MKVQTKILLLLVFLLLLFGGGLVALRVGGEGKFKAIADARQADRDRMFDAFLEERGDHLKALVEDSTNWDDLVRAIVKKDAAWADANLNAQMLATFEANALWVYRPDLTLFHSVNNRYADSLHEAPVPRELLQRMLERREFEHFFVRLPQGWMEVRGATIHGTVDRFHETKPQGCLLAARFWIDENLRRMALFTGYQLRIVSPTEEAPSGPGAEERGLIRFSRDLPGWDGKTVAQIRVEHDSPIIRELFRSWKTLFLWLAAFAVALSLILSVALNLWVRRPLRLISRRLEENEPDRLEAIRSEPDEFGRLAALILRYRHTQEALQRTEEELRHSQKLDAVGRLAGGIAHDFNNLLTAIIGYSELLERRLAHQPDLLEDIGCIRDAGERAAALTRQLLAFSRKQLLEPRVVEIDPLVLGMERLLHRVIGEHIHITLELECSGARVNVDPNQFEQVILNLGVNARDAMPHGGTLAIHTSLVPPGQAPLGGGDGAIPTRDGILLTVTDSGSGMDALTKERIFEPFFTTKALGKGTGLGLSMAYGFVKQSGGSITVDSELGRGTTFRIYLPRETAPLAALPPSLPAATGARAAEAVLVVEDEPLVRQLVCDVLSDAGYEVLCASRPSEAIRMVSEHVGPLQLLVTDVVMPEMHGPMLANALAPLHPHMAVLYVTGYSENDISEQGVIYAGLEVVQKPFSRETLMHRVRQVLDRAGNPRPTPTGHKDGRIA